MPRRQPSSCTPTARRRRANPTPPLSPTPTPGVPSDWDEAWRDPLDLDGDADNGESTPYVKDLMAKMGSDLLGLGIRARTRLPVAHVSGT